MIGSQFSLGDSFVPAPFDDGIGTLASVQNMTPAQIATRRLKAAMSASATYRAKAAQYWRAYKGDPFEPEDSLYMEAVTDRPVVRYNIFIGTINAIAGSDQAEQREARFSGVDKSPREQAIGQWLTQITRLYHRRANGPATEHAMFIDKLVTGMGWNRLIIDQTRWPWVPKQEHVEAWKVHRDPAATKANWSDMRWFFVEERWHWKDVKAQWPGEWMTLCAAGIAGAGANSGYLGETGGVTRAVSNNYGAGSSAGYPVGSVWGEEVEPTVRIFTHQYIDSESWVAFTDPTTGKDVTMSLDDFNGDAKSTDPGKLGRRRELAASGFDTIQHVTYPKAIYRNAFYAASADGGSSNLIELEDLPLPFQSFTYVCDTGFLDKDPEKGYVESFGMGHVCFDPQRYISKILSFMLEMLRRSSSGGVWLKAGGLVSPHTFLQDYARPGAPILIRDEVNIKDVVQDRAQPTWPSAMERFFSIVTDGLPDITGVTKAFKGTSTQDRSGVAVQSLTSQTASMLNPLVAPTMTARQNLARLHALFILNYLSDEAVNRVIGDDPIPGVNFQQDPMTGGLVYPPEQIPDPSGQVDPQSGQPAMVPNPQANSPLPIMVPDPSGAMDPGQPDPAAGQPGQPQPRMVPLTPAMILRQADIMEYEIDVDLGVASINTKEAMWRIFTDTNLLPQMQTAGIEMAAVLPDLVKLLPLPPEMAARLAKKFEMAARKQTPDLIMESVKQMSPDDSNQLLQSLAQMLGATIGDPQGKPPAETMSFTDLPIAGKIQMAKQSGIILTPADFAASPPPDPSQPDPMQPVNGGPPPQ